MDPQQRVHWNRAPGWAALRLRRPRLAVVGCGDVGRRIVARLSARLPVLATHRAWEQAASLRALGARPMHLDLDGSAPPAGARRREQRARARLRSADTVFALFPPPPHGRGDPRARRLAHLLAGAPRSQRLVYVSTSGVYGDRGGAWLNEATPPSPSNDRAWRRLAAEQSLRSAPLHARVLRVPGIYDAARLPLERLRSGLPAPAAGEDGYTNHIHADDLARALLAAMARGAPRRIYHAADDLPLTVGAYLDCVADHHGLPRPPRAGGRELAGALGEARMSFLRESRRLDNGRLKHELRLRLNWPSVPAFLAGMPAPAGDQASNSPSTER
jgi:nucleoside-diphosphate-sugar epimerase